MVSKKNIIETMSQHDPTWGFIHKQQLCIYQLTGHNGAKAFSNLGMENSQLIGFSASECPVKHIPSQPVATGVIRQ